MKSMLSPRARRSPRPRSTLSVALLLAVLGVGTVEVTGIGTAGAVPTCTGTPDDIDTVRIDTGSTGKVDFGDDPHLFGAPQNAAKICWYRTNSSIFVELDGELYWDDLFAGGCAEIDVTFFDSQDRVVRPSLTTAESVKSPGGLRQVNVWQQASAANLDRVRIRLFRSNTQCAGDVQVASVTRSFGD